jgi:hypothetical protein
MVLLLNAEAGLQGGEQLDEGQGGPPRRRPRELVLRGRLARVPPPRPPPPLVRKARPMGLGQLAQCEWIPRELRSAVRALADHPTASRRFAWEVDGEITAVIAEGPVQTATDAVRASIYADGTREPEASTFGRGTRAGRCSSRSAAIREFLGNEAESRRIPDITRVSRRRADSEAVANFVYRLGEERGPLDRC